MKRKLFFLLEKLEIKRSERITISLLLALLVVISSISLILEPYANYEEQEYRQLEKVFEEKNRSIEKERGLILARYDPEQTSPQKKQVSEEVKGDTVDTDSTDQPSQYGAAADLIDINNATLEQLQELPGIGPTYAQRILDWIEENGPFTSKNQLLEIKGIGDKRLAKIKPLITL